METKKISFGFSKINKKTNLLPVKQNVQTETEVELIKCLEGHEIKLLVEKQETAPLVIPLKESQKTSTALASLLKRRAVLLGEDELAEVNEESPQSVVKEQDKETSKTEDLEKRAALELLADIKGHSEAGENSNLVLPIVKPDDLPLDGAKESTLDDYENIPIQEFGVAMLRGMGWVEPAKKKGGQALDEPPMVRPKGMGLGADKALKLKPLLVPPEKNEVLEIKKQAYIRILGGKHKDLYGQIEGFDDHAGRVIVKMAIGGAKEAFNEFLCQPVSKKEYSQYGKCINTAKYEEYKKKENEQGIRITNEKEEPKNKQEHLKKMTDKIDIKTKRNDDIKFKQEKADTCKYKENKQSQRKTEDRYERRLYYSEGRKKDDNDKDNEYDKKHIKKEKSEIFKSKDDSYYDKKNYDRYDHRRDNPEDRTKTDYTEAKQFERKKDHSDNRSKDGKSDFNCDESRQDRRNEYVEKYNKQEKRDSKKKENNDRYQCSTDYSEDRIKPYYDKSYDRSNIYTQGRNSHKYDEQEKYTDNAREIYKKNRSKDSSKYRESCRKEENNSNYRAHCSSSSSRIRRSPTPKTVSSSDDSESSDSSSDSAYEHKQKMSKRKSKSKHKTKKSKNKSRKQHRTAASEESSSADSIDTKRHVNKFKKKTKKSKRERSRSRH